MWTKTRYGLWGLIFLFLPGVASAHEVYVLSPAQIQYGLSMTPFSEWQTLVTHLGAFTFWALVTILTVAAVFIFSISRTLEKRLDPFLVRARHYAPFVARVTGGMALIMCAYHGALFGPELPLSAVFGPYAAAARLLIALSGLLILTGLWVRAAALIVLGFFAAATIKYGSYMFTYTNYFGEVVVLLILGAHRISLERAGRVKDIFHTFFTRITKRYARYSIAILRAAFGISLLFASLYAKFFHNYLALQVAMLPFAGHAHSLAEVFGFEPHFLVLGAGIMELVIAAFFILGIEIRFTALFLEIWLSLSLLYFGEIVWPHLILIGLPIAFFLYGYDQYSIEGKFFKKRGHEPVL